MMVFDTALQTGLRRDARNPRNTQALVECANLLPSPYGLKKFVAEDGSAYIYDPMTPAKLGWVSMTKSWPFPQLMRLNAITLLMDSQKIYEFDEYQGVNYWMPTGYPLQEPLISNVPLGGTWHAADFYDRVFLFNGAAVVYQDYDNGVVTWKNQSDVTINTGCAHKEGRLFYGGFDPADFYTSVGWDTYLEELAENSGMAEYLDLSVNGPGPNWVWWSSIGGGDVLWLFPSSGLDLAKEGRLAGQGRIIWAEMAHKNQSGLRPMPFRGFVQQMLPMGANVVVYGQDGVAALVSASSPAPTYGLYKFPELGTRLGTFSRDAAAGGDVGQFFIDEGGTAWMIGPDLRVEKIGYQEYFSQLGNNTVVRYDDIRREFWISDGVESYVLTQTGLSKAPWCVFSLSGWGGKPVGVIQETASPEAITIVTEAFDGGERGIWEVETVRLAATDTDRTWEVAIDWRMDKAEAWSRTDPVTADERGIARLSVSGLEFRVVLTHEDRTKTDLERIEVELRGEGRRSIKRLTV